MEAALRRSEERERARANELAALMDAMPAIIWIARDPACEDMVGNEYSHHFLQQEKDSPAAPAQQPAFTTKTGQPIPTAELPMQLSAATGKSVKEYEFNLTFPNGSVYHLLGNVNPLFDPAGKPAGAIGAFLDITSLRHLEEEKVRARTEIEVQRRLIEQREQERQTIARDLHDGPIQTLSSSTFQLHMLKMTFPDPRLHFELDQIGRDIKNTIQELRLVLNDLRPPVLMHFGFDRVIQLYAKELCERFPGIEIDLEVSAEGNGFSDQARLALFRIYQAGMNNIVRHAGATRAVVTYQKVGSHFYLELRDNGKGFELADDFAQLTQNGRFGLAGMRERAQAFGWDLVVSSQPGSGTVVIIQGELKTEG
jgi:two-component system sensor histidine kinase DegS